MSDDEVTLLLRHRGRDSGTEHVTQLAYQVYGDHYVVASVERDQPDWLHDLLAAPETTVEVGGQTFPVSAHVAEGPEREKLREWRADHPELGPALLEREQSGSAVVFVVLDRTDTLNRKKAFNREVVAEYRRTGGRVEQTMDGLSLSGMQLLLLHHRGRSSGREYVNPLSYKQHGDGFLVVGTNGGSPDHPDWFHNLHHAPDTVIEVGARTLKVRARVVEGEERRALMPDHHSPERRPQREGRFGAYDQFITREIPLVFLEPVD